MAVAVYPQPPTCRAKKGVEAKQQPSTPLDGRRQKIEIYG